MALRSHLYYIPLWPTLALLFLVQANPGFGANPAGPYLLAPDSPGTINITPYTSYLPDDAQPLDIRNLAALARQPWQATTDQSYLQYGISESARWIRIAIHNPEGTSQQRFVELSKPLIDSVEVGIINSSGETHYQLGVMQPFNERVVRHRNLVIPLTLPPAETTTVYMRFQSSKALTFSISLLTRHALQIAQRNHLFITGLYLGSASLVMLLCAYQCLRYRRRSYLYLGLVTASLILFNATQSGYGQQFLWPDNQWLSHRASVLTTSLTAALGTSFGAAFLSINGLAPALRRALIFMATANVLLFIGAIIVPYGASIEITLLAAVTALLLTAACAINISIKYRGRFILFLLGWLALGGSALISLTHVLGWMQPSQLAEQGFLIGSALAPVLWLLALWNQAEHQAVSSLQQQRMTIIQQQHRETHLQRSLQQSLEENRNYALLLKKADRLDAVTGLLNLSAYYEEMGKSHRIALRYGNTLSVVALEICDLQRINQNQGHKAGDACLAGVARIVTNSLQRPGDIAGRLTGSRLGIVLPYTDIDGALAVVQRINRGVQAWMEQEDAAPSPLHLRAGIASTENRLARHADDLIESALAQVQEIRA